MSISRKVVKRLFPRNTKRGKALIDTAVKLNLAKPLQYDEDYQSWIKRYEQDAFLLPLKGHRQTPNKPLFSIIIPFYNTADKYLDPLLDSIVSQSFTDWELIIGDASTIEERSAKIKAHSGRDERFVYHRIHQNGGISHNTNEALSVAKGQYIVFADHDDTLSPHALNEVAVRLAEDKTIDIFYSDEDKLTDDGKLRHSPFFKPDWSPHMFLNANYTNHLSVVRKELVDAVKGLVAEKDGAQDYDFLLRIHSLPRDIKVCHIDKILYHWREADGSTAANFENKLYAYEAGRKALEEHIERNGWKGTSEMVHDRPGFYRLRLYPKKKQKVLAIIAIGAVSEATYRLVLQQVQVATTSRHVEVEFKQVQSKREINELIKKSQADVMLVVQRPILPTEDGWIDELCGALAIENAAVVAPRIIGKGDVVIDLGLVRMPNGAYYPMLYNYPSNLMTAHSHPEWIHDVDSLSGAVALYPAEMAKKIDFTLPIPEQVEKLKPKGKYVVVWSHCTLYDSGAYAKGGGFFNNNLNLDGETLVIHGSRARR